MNEEDLNPAQPNIHDEALSGVSFFVKCIFASFTLAVVGIIVWFALAVTRKPKVVEEYASYYPMNGMAIYPDDAVTNVLVMNNLFFAVTNQTERFTVITNRQPERWFSFTYTDNNWHWTNVVFSSTREPVVTKTNGEWRIEFK